MNLFYFKCIIEDKVNSINLWVKWLRERVQDKLKNVGGKNI